MGMIGIQTLEKDSSLNSAMDDRVVSEDLKDKADPVTTKTADQWGSYLEAIKSTHDVAAFEALFGHFAPRIKSFLLKSGADANLAEECAQEVMVTVWNKAHLFDPTRASAATWIFTIARNKKIDAFGKRPARTDELPWGPDHEPDQADVIALNRKQTNWVAHLPNSQKSSASWSSVPILAT